MGACQIGRRVGRCLAENHSPSLAAPVVAVVPFYSQLEGFVAVIVVSPHLPKM
jgi:hypothetical protein